MEDCVHGLPLQAGVFHHGACLGGELVVLALATGLRLAPTSNDESIGLQSMKNWVQHAICPLDLPGGQFLDPLDDGVPVAFPSPQDAQNDGAGGGGIEVLADLHGATMHCVSMHASARYYFSEIF